MAPATQDSGFAPQSALCAERLGARVIRSSVGCGWSSLLLEHHRIHPTFEVFETAPTPDQTIVVMLSGEQDIEAFKGGAWRRAFYRSGTVGLTPGLHVDRLRRRPLPGRNGFEKANLYVPERIVREAIEEHRRAGQAPPRWPLTSLAFQDPTILHTVSALLRAIDQGLPDLYAQAASCWMAMHLLATHANWVEAEDARPRAAKVSSRRIAAVRERMQACFGEPLSLHDLASDACVSKFYFVREFRRHYGITPHAILFNSGSRRPAVFLPAPTCASSRSPRVAVSKLRRLCAALSWRGWTRRHRNTVNARKAGGMSPLPAQVRDRSERYGCRRMGWDRR